MSTQVVVTLPDEVYRRAERLARLMSRDVADVLADTIALSLPPADERSGGPGAVAELPAHEVLELAETQMEPSQDRRLSALLDKQQSGDLTESERSELSALMQIYQERLLRKAQALNEAVRRGLRPPLEP
jgi:hypothetical protein